MAARNASVSERGSAGVLLGLLVSAGAVLALTIALLLASWVIEWVMVFKVWSEGNAHLKDLLDADLAWLAMHPHPLLDPRELAIALANACYALIFEVTGIHAMALTFAEGDALSIPDTITRTAYGAHHEGIEVAMSTTQLFGVRLTVLLLTVPIFVLGYGIGLAEGLAQRAIRKARGGHESSNLYHRAKYAQVALLAITGSLILLLPISLDARWLCGPAVVCSALLARLQWTYYKKHL